MKEDKMHGECSTHERIEMFVKFLSGNVKQGGSLQLKRINVEICIKSKVGGC
jgi:hypothetical protein